jgi:hypothetical protein
MLAILAHFGNLMKDYYSSESNAPFWREWEKFIGFMHALMGYAISVSRNYSYFDDSLSNHDWVL